MVAFALLAFMPLLSMAVPSDQWIEESSQSSDGESPVLDSLDVLADSLFEPGFVFGGSRDKVRFQSSAQWRTTEGEENTVGDLWSRSRLTTQSGSKFRSEFLAVRRVGDPRTVDEIHLTVSTEHRPSGVQFTVGTYQVDWGFGALSSSSFGSARSFSSMRSVSYLSGRGVVAKPATAEASWLRGIALTREIARAKLSAWASLREWNADTNESPARLTGLLATNSATALNRRDQVSERLFGTAVRLQRNFVSAGLLLQASAFDPEIDQTAATLLSYSAFGSAVWNGLLAQTEFARSANRSACIAALSKATPTWQGVVYSVYADKDFFAPRSQSAFSFGDPLENDRMIGARLGVMRNGHDVALDLRSNRTPGSTGTRPANGRHDELLGAWTYSPSPNIRLNAKTAVSITDDVIDGVATERRSQSVRFEPEWRKGLVWSLRSETRLNNTSNGADRQTGHYLHLQAVRNDGTLRPGIRVAVFDLKDLPSPMLVYEPSVSGAYPIESLSGSGTRTSAWLGVSLANLTMKLKIAHDSRLDSADDLDLAFAITYHR